MIKLNARLPILSEKHLTYTYIAMIEREIYKGIEFVRISNLIKEQSEHIRASFPKEKIIKILRDEVILKDCIQYHDYQEWFRKSYQGAMPVVDNKAENVHTNSFDLALK